MKLEFESLKIDNDDKFVSVSAVLKPNQDANEAKKIVALLLQLYAVPAAEGQAVPSLEGIMISDAQITGTRSK